MPDRIQIPTDVGQDILDQLTQYSRILESARLRPLPETPVLDPNIEHPIGQGLIEVISVDEHNDIINREMTTLDEMDREDAEASALPPDTPFNVRHPGLPPYITTEDEAFLEGYVLDDGCNCTDCRQNRQTNPTYCQFLVRHPEYHNRFQFQPYTFFGDSMRAFMPKVDTRFGLGRSHNIKVVMEWGGNVFQSECDHMHEGLLGNCSVCGESLYSKARARYGMWGGYGLTRLPDGRWVCNDCLIHMGDVFLCHLCGSIDLKYEPNSPEHDDDEDDQDGCNFREISNRDSRFIVCLNCAEEECSPCWNCEQTYANNDMSEGDDEHDYCPHCWNENFIHCCDCDETCSSSGSEETRNGDYVCESCYENGWHTCESCERAVRAEDGQYSENGDEWVCNRCRRNNGPRNPRVARPVPGSDGLLREHSYKPRPFFRTTKGESIKDTLFFGFELETENILNRHGQDDHILWMQNFWEERKCGKFCYYKWDGSLHNGIEIVSHPMSWSWLQQHKPMFTEFLAGLRSRGLRSFNTDTCGLHIHMNKSAYFGTRLYKYLKFFHTNGDFLWKISGRASFDAMSEWAKVDTDGAARRILLKEAKEKYKRDGGKYWAINLEPEHTLEIRIFKGTLGEVSFFRAFEFVKSLYEFCAPGIYKISEVSLGRYMQYVKERGELYPNLKARLDSPRFHRAEAEEGQEN